MLLYYFGFVVFLEDFSMDGKNYLIEKLKQVVSELNIDKGVPAAQASYDGVQEISSPAPSSSPKENPMEKLSAVLDDDDTSEQETASVEDQGEVDDQLNENEFQREIIRNALQGEQEKPEEKGGE